MGSSLPFSATAMPTAGLAAVSVDREVVLIRLSDMTKLCTVFTTASPPEKDVNLVSAFSQDGSLLAVGAEDGKVRVFSLTISKPGDDVEVSLGEMRESQENTEGIKNLSFHSAGRHLMAACEDGTWRVWLLNADSLEEQECIVATSAVSNVKGEVKYTCRSCRFTHDGTRLFTIHYVRRGPKGVDKSSYLTRWEVSMGGDAEKPKLKFSLGKAVAISKFPVLCLALCRNGKVGAAGTAEGQVVIFRTDDMAFSTQQRHNFSVTEVSFSETAVTWEPQVLSASGDKTVWVVPLQVPTASVL